MKLWKAERLRHIIVRAHVEPTDAVLFLFFTREHNDRRLDAALAQQAANLLAVAARKDQIEQNNVEMLRFGSEQSAIAIIVMHDLIVLLFEANDKSLCDNGIILD